MEIYIKRDERIRNVLKNNTMKTLHLLFLIIIFLVNTISCLAQEPEKELITEIEFKKITLVEKFTIQELKTHEESWNLLEEQLGDPLQKEEKDEFVNKSKFISYKEADFRYSDYGKPDNFTLTNIAITEPGFYLTVKGKRLQVGDDIEKAAFFNHSRNEADSTLSIKIYETDEEGNVRYHDSGELMTAENEYLSVKFDPSTGKITEINFMWRIV